MILGIICLVIGIIFSLLGLRMMFWKETKDSFPLAVGMIFFIVAGLGLVVLGLDLTQLLVF